MTKEFVFIDLFSGAGGVTTGIETATRNGVKIARVIAAVNHDDLAIQSHSANHPATYHFVEDIRILDVDHLVDLVKREKTRNPDCVVCLWASAECTNYSRAKGGLPRNQDSRTLPEHLLRYLHALPDIELFFLENVEEFMCWGPLDENGKPVSRYCGIDYIRWVESVKALGFEYDYRILNAADFGAYTSRKRYFGIFSRPGVPVCWPVPTHSRKPDGGGLFGGLSKWKPVREVLDLAEEGRSIFNRKKPLSDATLRRIYAGLKKYVRSGESAFITKHFSGNPDHKLVSLDSPAGSLTTVDHHSLVQTTFLAEYHGTGTEHSIDKPSITLTTKDRLAVIQAEHFIDKQYSSGGQNQSIETPAGSLTTVPKLNLVRVEHGWLMDTQYNNVGSDLESPSPVITANRKYHYLVNPQFNNGGSGVDKPCFTLIARMDKRPPSLVSVSAGLPDISISESDSPIMRQIKAFMAENNIVDIKMRMLSVVEMLRIQGFPSDYVLIGNQGHKKKFIGNSVPPVLVRALIESVWSGYIGSDLDRLAV
ncbi:MAG: DNA cytosine methyltransferase [Bacteroidetes bacterium]|nr:DNA cytosine methyltransferase [Bacteroidota bacterium]